MARAETRDTRFASSIQDAHLGLIGRLQQNKPHRMHAWHLADALDFEDRAEHARRLLIAVEDYVRALMVDTARSSNIYVDTDVTGCIADMRGDVVGTLLNAAEELSGVAHGRAA
jgi:hypothetical protein